MHMTTGFDTIVIIIIVIIVVVVFLLRHCIDLGRKRVETSQQFGRQFVGIVLIGERLMRLVLLAQRGVGRMFLLHFARPETSERRRNADALNVAIENLEKLGEEIERATSVDQRQHVGLELGGDQHQALAEEFEALVHHRFKLLWRGVVTVGGNVAPRAMMKNGEGTARDVERDATRLGIAENETNTLSSKDKQIGALNSATLEAHQRMLVVERTDTEQPMRALVRRRTTVL
jgi:hypothetical protein